MRSYPGFCRRKQLEYNPGLTHRRRAGHPRANRRTSDRPSFFQSTHPLRGATLSRRFSQSNRPAFQSTHPLRGATPRTDIGKHGQNDFNPRTPCGVRRCETIKVLEILRFQSTHPLRGATLRKARFRPRGDHFNPRTPCGVRQQNCRNIPGKFAQKLQNFCKAEQRAALPRVGQRESGCYFRPCAVRTSRGKPECFRFASDNERALRSVARL